MTAKLTIIFFIILCLEAGLALTLLPWISFGNIGDWSDNFFLLWATKQTGWTSLPSIIGSGWVRGAISGLGLLNIGIAFWEIANFNQTTQLLDAKTRKAKLPVAE